VRTTERIPTGVSDLQALDRPAYERRGVELGFVQHPVSPDTLREKIDKSDHDKPAFLRKVMD
jgi:hypothetical protein